MLTGKRTKLPMVALMGVDGSGKSSVLNLLRNDFASSLKIDLIVLHRGKVTSELQNSGEVFDHYTDQPYPWFISILKLFVKAVDWLGYYWIKLASLRDKGYLVITDRFYFHDLSVDPLRYRYGGPIWLVKAVARLLPKPDLYILLDAPAQLLFERKKEVPEDEIARQRTGYLELVKNLPKAYVVDVTQPLEKVAADTWQIILNHMSPEGS